MRSIYILASVAVRRNRGRQWLTISVAGSFDRRRDTDFRRRRECCREECSRRGVPHLYHLAEETISPRAA